MRCAASIHATTLLFLPCALSAQLQVDTADREMTRQFYQAVYFAAEGAPLEWTGSYAGAGAPGQTSAAWQEAVRLRINYFRAMAGVPAWVEFDDTYSAKAQAAALIMSGEGNVSHAPPANWAYFSADGFEGAQNSNLALGSFGTGSVDGYMRDWGANNAAVGHRKWLLHPPHRVMGTGDVPGDSARGFLPANAIWVFDGNTFNAYPALRDGFIAWPPPGHVPYDQVYPRWSFGAENADLSTATVSMTRDGSPVDVLINYRSDNPRDLLVWVPEGLNPNDLAAGWMREDADVLYTVRIDGARVSGVPTTFEYTVTLMDPAVPTAGSGPAWIAGDAAPAIGFANSYRAIGPHFAEDYVWRAIETSAAAYTLDGAGLGVFIDQTSPAYPAVQRGIYKLARPANDRAPQYLEIGAELLAGAQAALSFRSRLGYATDQQAARVEVSLDGGVSWQAVWEQFGVTNNPETGFSTRNIDLAAHAGRTLRLRFAYISGNYFYTGGDGNVGWSFDDVVLSDFEEVIAASESAATADGIFTFTPTDADAIHLQSRAQAFGGFDLEWGLARRVQPAVGPEPSAFAPYPSTGGGWRDTAFDRLNDARWPFVYHDEHGWLRVTGNPGNLWVYELARGRWWWTSSLAYSWFHDMQEQRWVYHQRGTATPARQFWTPADGWFSE